MVANYTEAISTDTIHRVRVKAGVDAGQLAVSFYNVLTFAFAEIMGRSYGGGVLEIEPGETGHLPLPFFRDNQLSIEELDHLERAGKGQEILTITNQLLHDKLHIDAPDCQRLKTIWTKLSERRTGRKATSKKTGGN
jgi:adenine-specific DNA-methyltransferase